MVNIIFYCQYTKPMESVQETVETVQETVETVEGTAETVKVKKF